MTDELFPHRAQIGGRYGFDADHLRYRDDGPNTPNKLTVTQDAEVGRLYGPDGRSYRVVREDRSSVRFGFHAG